MVAGMDIKKSLKKACLIYVQSGSKGLKRHFLSKIKDRNTLRNDNSKENFEDNFPSINTKNVLKTKLILIIAELSLPQCKLYRVDAKVNAFEKLGFKVEVIGWQETSRAITLLQFASKIIFYRVPFTDSVRSLYKEVRRLNKKIYYDIDDLIFDYDEYHDYLKSQRWLSKSEKENLLHGSKLYQEALQNADVFIGSTEDLISCARIKYNKKTILLPNCIPELIYNTQENIRPNDNIIRIFYGSGSKTHNEDFSLIKEPIKKILREYKNVNLYILGHLELDEDMNAFRDQIKRISFLSARNYYRLLSIFDIALMPLVDNKFCRAKSNIKYIEASYFSIPSLASNLPEFSNVIENGVNGFICKTKEEWFDNLKKIILDRDYAKKVGLAAKDNVHKKYAEKSHISYCKRIIDDQVLGLVNRTVEDEIVIVTANIYFGLNAFGGATIVAQELASEIKKRGYYSIAITHHKSDIYGTGTVRSYVWNNIIVFSICSNYKEEDLNNKEIGYLVELLAKYLKPKLFHLHAVQGMGYTLMQKCKEYNIPYVLTLHDFLYVCPKLFMMDVNGKLCNQKFIDPSICESKCLLPSEYVMNRLMESREILENASAVLTVSETHKINMSNFIKNKILINKNGIDIEIDKGIKNIDRKKVVFGYFGAREPVKGYFLLKEAFEELSKKSALKNIKLLMTAPEWSKNKIIDDFKNIDVEFEILDYQEHKNMISIYDSINVLLFPSLYPETFGLTVREAIARNCYIVTTLSAGAVNEAIRQEVNGISVNPTVQNLSDAIVQATEKLLNLKEYKTADYGDVIDFSQQAEEVIGIYKKII